MKAKKVLAKHINLKLYADMAEEIRTIFNTMPMERGTRVARKIARGVLKFGFTHAYSATQVLNDYDKNYINMVLDNIDYSSLLIVIQSAFSHHPSQSTAPTSYELRNIFNKHFMKKFNFGEDDPTKKSLIVVNNYISELKLHSHKQSIGKSDIEYFKSLERNI